MANTAIESLPPLAAKSSRIDLHHLIEFLGVELVAWVDNTAAAGREGPALWPNGSDYTDGTSTGRVCLDTHVFEASCPALGREGLGLVVCPPVAGETGGAGTRVALDREEPAPRGEHPPCLGESRGDVRPVVNGRQRPHRRCPPVRLPQIFRSAFGPGDGRPVASQHPSEPEHHRCRIHAGYPRPTAGGFPDRSAGAATDVDHTVSIRHRDQVSGEAGNGAPYGDHREAGQQSGHPGEARMVGVVVDGISSHDSTLQVQAGLKSNEGMDPIPIGQAADRLGLSPSALRYYDERGLVSPPARHAGRRMYGPDELRRLAFLKIAHELGLPLDTAAAILNAPGPQWRQTVRRQIAQLDKMIAQAQGAQKFLTHALNCPTDHPARDCATMIATLDRLVDGTTVDQLAAEHT